MTEEPKPRVLIVEDTPILRRYIGDALANAEIPVVGEARNGAEGIEEARRVKPDVILLDVVMPVMNGTEALPQLRAALPNALILMLTSTSEASVVEQARRGGANGYILKHENDIATVVPDKVMRAWRAYRERLPGAPRPEAPRDD